MPTALLRAATEGQIKADVQKQIQKHGTGQKQLKHARAPSPPFESRFSFFSDVPIHSLRHAAATWLRDAGVSENLAMELIGHDSESADRSYVHTSPDAMRDALNRLPSIS